MGNIQMKTIEQLWRNPMPLTLDLTYSRGNSSNNQVHVTFNDNEIVCAFHHIGPQPTTEPNQTLGAYSFWQDQDPHCLVKIQRYDSTITPDDAEDFLDGLGDQTQIWLQAADVQAADVPEIISISFNQDRINNAKTIFRDYYNDQYSTMTNQEATNPTPSKFQSGFGG